MSDNLPLAGHALDKPSLFSPHGLIEAVRQYRGAGRGALPRIGILDFDGDLTDKLVSRGEVRQCLDWPCFHTRMWLWPASDPRCGIVDRSIGGPYTVLVAEQMAACGMESIVGLASAGRLAVDLPIPALVIAAEAVRDEGTSYHYLPASETVTADVGLVRALERTTAELPLPKRTGLIWTTDAPYRETRAQVDHWAARGALAVEMQAASLFAFAQRMRVRAALVAHVTNSVGIDDPSFDKGPEDGDVAILEAVVAAAEERAEKSSR